MKKRVKDDREARAILSALESEKTKDNQPLSSDERTKLLKKLTKLLNIDFHFYQTDPIMFIMGFGQTMFVEQYHFGRPEGEVQFGGCIGKHVPVFEYSPSSKAYKFYTSHYEFTWNSSQDITLEVVDKAISQYVKRNGKPSTSNTPALTPNKEGKEGDAGA